jgi:hypothetical protein
MSYETMARIEKKLDMLLAHLGANGARPAGKAGASGVVADDADLDSKWGDPEIKRSPPRWSGPNYDGRRFSEADPAFLDAMAGFLDWKAGKAEEENKVSASGNPVAPLIRKDAARARGWAARLRAGTPAAAPREAPQRQVPEWKGTPAQGDAFEGDSDLPF